MKTVTVIEIGEDYAERVEEFQVAFIGTTEEEVIDEAIKLVEARGYTVVRDEDGGCCEIGNYFGTPEAVAITVEPKS